MYVLKTKDNHDKRKTFTVLCSVFHVSMVLIHSLRYVHAGYTPTHQQTDTPTLTHTPTLTCACAHAHTHTHARTPTHTHTHLITYIFGGLIKLTSSSLFDDTSLDEKTGERRAVTHNVRSTSTRGTTCKHQEEPGTDTANVQDECTAIAHTGVWSSVGMYCTCVHCK